MCGIVGLFLKDKSLEPELGAMLTKMLVTMTDRGPDSAGIAIYSDDSMGKSKLSCNPIRRKRILSGWISHLARPSARQSHENSPDTHAVLAVPHGAIENARAALATSILRCAS